MNDPFDWREPHEAARQRAYVHQKMPLARMDADNPFVIYAALTFAVFFLIIVGGVLTA